MLFKELREAKNESDVILACFATVFPVVLVLAALVFYGITLMIWGGERASQYTFFDLLFGVLIGAKTAAQIAKNRIARLRG